MARAAGFYERHDISFKKSLYATEQKRAEVDRCIFQAARLAALLYYQVWRSRRARPGAGVLGRGRCFLRNWRKLLHQLSFASLAVEGTFVQAAWLGGGPRRRRRSRAGVTSHVNYWRPNTLLLLRGEQPRFLFAHCQPRRAPTLHVISKTV
jgi:hypothetical protein